MADLNETGVRETLSSLNGIAKDLKAEREQAEADEAHAQSKLIRIRKIEHFVNAELAAARDHLRAIEAAKEAEHGQG